LFEKRARLHPIFFVTSYVPISCPWYFMIFIHN
jgi:hypothetical protein